MSEEYGQMRTPPPCCRQGVAAQALRVLVIAIVLPPEASPKRVGSDREKVKSESSCLSLEVGDLPLAILFFEVGL